VQPARTVIGSEDFGPVEVAGFDLADGGVATVAASCGSAKAEPALREVETIADSATHAVVRNPAE